MLFRSDTSAGPQPVTIQISAQPAADFMETVTTRAAVALNSVSRLHMRLKIVKTP